VVDADIVHDMIPSVIGRIGEVLDIGLWLQWFDQLDRTFIFLLTLPFEVALVGLWAAYRDRSLEQTEEAARPVESRPQKPGETAATNRQAWRGPALRE
jgi:hypothetical protein